MISLDPADLRGRLIIGSAFVDIGPERRRMASERIGTPVASADAQDAGRALVSAREAQAGWGCSPVETRIELIGRLVAALRDRYDEIARLIMLETGKTGPDADAELSATIGTLTTLVTAAPAATAVETTTRDGVSVIDEAVPVGPSLLITPWNFPLSLAARKVASALLAGCPAILKPSDRTPLTGLALGALLIDAGAPPGTVSVLPSMDAPAVVAALMADHTLRKVSFTGSTRVGQAIMGQSVDRLQRVQLELGGNAPAVVTEQADVEAAMATVWGAKTHNAGQVCVAPDRLIVHRSVADRVRAALVDLIDRTVFDEPGPSCRRIGPVIDRLAFDRLEALIGQDHGGAVYRAARSDPPRLLVAPAAVFSPDLASPLWTDETFGPVLPMRVYSTIDEAIALANDTSYGLAGYVFTEEPDEARLIGSRLEVGMVGVNRPSVSHPLVTFGGSKMSGLGRENGIVGIRSFCEPRSTIQDDGHA